MTRKLLLFLFAMAIVVSTVAQKAKRQNAVPSKYVPVLAPGFIENESSSNYVVPTTPFLRESKGPSVISKTLIGGARNIFGGLLSFQTCLTYNQELDNILFTHRGNDKGTIVPFGTGNDIITSLSVNGGTSFDSKMAMSNGLGNRYPSGVIYNPTGNTDTTNAYSVVVGPITSTASTWASMFLHSGKYDGTGQDHQEVATDPTFLELMRNGLTATSDGKFHVSAIGTTLNSGSTAYLTCKLFDMNGTWNSTDNKVDWATKGEITPNLVAAPSDNGLYLHGSYTQAAWSKDGSVGYLLMLGGDNRPANKPSVTPIVWKSTNGGATWTIIDYFDWSSLTAITDWIFPTKYDPTVYKPYFEEASMVVDANNKPHIFGLVRGGYSADLDSLSYIYVRSSTQTIMDGNIVELYLDDSDVWQGNWIDSISADAVPYTKSPYVYSPNNVGWDHRLSASVCNDGQKIFCTWTDSDWIFWGTEAYDLNPDLKGWARDISNSGPFDSPTNFTANTDLWGLAFFHFTSPEAIDLSLTDTELPVVITDINTTGLQAIEPVYYYYVKGCDFIWSGINDQSSKNSVKASACYPNPFNGTTKVDVTIAKSADVAISVYDIAGQLISSTNYGTLTAGKHPLTIDGSKLHGGVYFYTVTVGEQKFNNKMIVK